MTIIEHNNTIKRILYCYAQEYNLRKEARRVDKVGFTGFYGVFAEQVADHWLFEARKLRIKINE